MRITETGAAPHVTPPAALPGRGPDPAGLSARQTLLFAGAVAFMVMNLFAVQTMGPEIARTLGLGEAGMGGAGWLGMNPRAHPIAALAILTLAAVVLDAGVIGEQTLGRRGINLVRPQARGRMNGLFVGIFFIGGSIGSALAGAAWSWMGWNGVCVVGLALSAVLMVFYWAAPRTL